jgi:pseudouridine-5'-phosphate glycosidase
MDKSYFEISEEIQIALKDRKPVVALESTLISHGLPYPINLDVAKSSMNAVRSSGSIPATIAIINGKIKVGLNNDDINILSQNNNIEKVSSHNFAISISNKNHAATTVASTIYLASKIGIKFFATGGIGGVHLDFENNFDISADLIELSKTKMNVICSGAKSILDLDKTFEILETLRIPRLGFKTNYMPGFWFYNTDKKVDHNFNDINELINYLKIRDHIDQTGSVLIFNPVPKNKSIDEKLIQKWIKLSIDKAKINSIKGKELTPFLIKEINKMSENKTLEANIELIINNAALAGKLAKKYYS